MNSRIYKKQNKRAMQKLLALAADGGGQYTSKSFYPSEKDQDWCVSKRFAKKFPSQDISAVYLRGTESESWYIRLAKGTPMFGQMSGYYEPEWDERPATEELIYNEMVSDAEYWEAVATGHINEAASVR